jgi:hypothetical protein
MIIYGIKMQVVLMMDNWFYPKNKGGELIPRPYPCLF